MSNKVYGERKLMYKNPVGEIKEVHVLKAGEWDFASMPDLILTDDWVSYMHELERTVQEGTCPLDDWQALKIIIKGMAVTKAGSPNEKIFSLEGTSNGGKSYCCYSSELRSVLWADANGEVYLLEE